MAENIKASLFQAPGEDMIIQGEQIEEIKVRMSRMGSTKEDTKEQISQLKKSFFTSRKSSSLDTVFAITNSMVGSVCLVIPQNFQQSGLILGTIIMFLICLISFKTCSLYVIHTKTGEADISDIIKRILGKKWKIAFCTSSFILMFLVGNIYFLLINNTLYPLICFILKRCHLVPGVDYFDPQAKAAIVFNMFSPQWLGVILIGLVSPFLFIKNVKLIVKMAHGGFFAIILYVLFIIYIFFDNMHSGNLKNHYSDVRYFSADIAGISGSFALAFMVHNAIAQIMSTNKIKENNKRDLGYGYLMAFLIYGFIGIFGAFGIVGRTHPDNASTITQYFDSDSIPPFIIEIFFSGHLITAFPLFCFISKIQFFNLVNDVKPAPQYGINIFNFVFACSCLLLQIFNVNVGIVIGITGAIVGFLIVYLLPALVHIKCINQCDQKENKEDLEVEFVDSVKRQESINNTQIAPCADHQISQRNKLFRYGFYLFLNLIGIYLVVIQLMLIFK